MYKVIALCLSLVACSAPPPSDGAIIKTCHSEGQPFSKNPFFVWDYTVQLIEKKDGLYLRYYNGGSWLSDDKVSPKAKLEEICYA